MTLSTLFSKPIPGQHTVQINKTLAAIGSTPPNQPIATQDLRHVGQSTREDDLRRKKDDTVISATASSIYKGTLGFASAETILRLFSFGDGQAPS